MQHVPSTFSGIIASWPSVADFARDLEIPYQTAAAMKRRGSIEPGHWPKLLEKAPSRGLDGLTWEALAKMAAGVALPEPRQVGAA